MINSSLTAISTPVAGTRLHGVCVVVHGKGVLILGIAGSGKSELALELVSRGHALVADDIVGLRRSGAGLTAFPDPALRGLLHIRDVGIINIGACYGSERVLPSCEIAVCVELTSGDNAVPEILPPAKDTTATWLGVSIPRYRLRSVHRRNPAAIIEAAALLERHQSSLQYRHM